MTEAEKTADRQKQAAAERAADYVRPGMAIGLGTGTTAAHLVRELAARLADGRLRDIVGVPTSERTRTLAEQLGVPLNTLDERPHLDVAIDGADEIAPNLDLIKGAGGALLREKMVATAATLFIVVGDASKRVERLGERFPVPVEVVKFGWKTQAAFLQSLGGAPALRVTPSGQPYVTDEGHYILDTRFPSIPDPLLLAAEIKARPGIVESGLFPGIAGLALVGTERGVDVLRPAGP